MKKVLILKGFTLIELVIAITISTLILGGILKFVGDALYEVGNSNNIATVLVEKSELQSEFSDFSRVYPLKQVLVDANKGEGTDIFLLKGIEGEAGILFAIIDRENSQIFSGTDYTLYSEKRLGYRKLNQAELTNVIATPSTAYNYTFFADNIYKNLYLADFQVELYNSGSIADLELKTYTNFDPELERENLVQKDIGDDKLYDFIINF